MCTGKTFAHRFTEKTRGRNPFLQPPTRTFIIAFHGESGNYNKHTKPGPCRPRHLPSSSAPSAAQPARARSACPGRSVCSRTDRNRAHTSYELQRNTAAEPLAPKQKARQNPPAVPPNLWVHVKEQTQSRHILPPCGKPPHCRRASRSPEFPYVGV